MPPDEDGFSAGAGAGRGPGSSDGIGAGTGETVDTGGAEAGDTDTDTGTDTDTDTDSDRPGGDDDDSDFVAPDRDRLADGAPTTGATGDAGPDPAGTPTDRLADPAAPGAGDRPDDSAAPAQEPDPTPEQPDNQFDPEAGLEDQRGFAADSPTGEAVTELQREIGREAPGVEAGDTASFNIVRSGGGGDRLTAEFAPETEQRIAERRVEQALAADDPESERQAEIQAQAEALREDVAAGTTDVAPEDVTLRVDDGQLVADPGVAALSEAEAAAGTRTDALRAPEPQADEAGLADRFVETATNIPQADEAALAERFAAIDERAAEAAPEVGAGFEPDRAPDRPARNPLTGAVRDATGAPSEREVAADFRAITGLPSEDELRRGVNNELAEAFGTRPRAALESRRERAAERTLDATSDTIQFAQDNPAAAAVAAPAALAEPTPLGEGALLAGAAAGVVGFDLASRVREGRDDEATIGSGSPFSRSELEPEEEPTAISELDVEEDPSPPELDQPGRDADGVAELPVPSRTPPAGELDIPQQERDAPSTIRTAELIGRQIGREREESDVTQESDNDRIVPEEFIPDEEQRLTDDGLPAPEQSEPSAIDGGEDPVFQPERPEQGVRAISPSAATEQSVRIADTFDDSPDPVVGRGSASTDFFGFGLNDRNTGADAITEPLDRIEAAQSSGIAEDNRIEPLAASRAEQRPAQTLELDQALDTAPEQATTEQSLAAQTVEPPAFEQPLRPAVVEPVAASPPGSSLSADVPGRQDATQDDDEEEPLVDGFGLRAREFTNPIETAEEFLGGGGGGGDGGGPR
jgi:hypothetical protein